MSDDEREPLDRCEELFAFLQGKVPESCRITRKNVPNLTADQAWTVIWYLGNEYWEVPDYIERCDICGDLYDSNDSGECLDFGKSPYFFCGGCLHSQEYERKAKKAPKARTE